MGAGECAGSWSEGRSSGHRDSVKNTCVAVLNYPSPNAAGQAPGLAEQGHGTIYHEQRRRGLHRALIATVSIIVYGKYVSTRCARPRPVTSIVVSSGKEYMVLPHPRSTVAPIRRAIVAREHVRVDVSNSVRARSASVGNDNAICIELR